MAIYAGLVGSTSLAVLVRDYVDGGSVAGSITGTTRVKVSASVSEPIACKVTLLRDNDKRPVRQGWSSAAGNWSFAGIDKSTTYTALGEHPTLAYRAIVADGVTPI